MKYILLISITILVMSCIDENDLKRIQDNRNSHRRDAIKTSVDQSYEEEIDSCQYIVLMRDRGIAITHKGNCSNPIHVYNKPKDKNEIALEKLEKSYQEFQKLFEEIKKDSL